MSIIFHLVGICFFAALAASGFLLTSQIIYWVLITIMGILAWFNYTNVTRNLKRIKDGKKLTPEMQKMLPYIENVDFNSRVVHLLFANGIHVGLVIALINAPVLACAITLLLWLNVENVLKFKDLIKKCHQ